MNFITIDFETATSARDSACELGLTIVKNNVITETRSWLIKPVQYPYFDYWNIAVHGIKPADVMHKPQFNQVWREIQPLFENNFVIAHNASFDLSVLRQTLDRYSIAYPTLQYACSVAFCKKIWTQLPAYDLKTLCYYNNITFNHHRAAADSRATAEMVIKAFRHAEIHSLEAFTQKLEIIPGQLFTGGYKAPSKLKRTIARNKVTGNDHRDYKSPAI